MSRIAAVPIVPSVSAGRRPQTRDDAGVDELLADPPLPYSAWSLDPETMALVAAEVRERRPRAVVELGCGASTIGIARVLATLTEGTVTALEHDPEWAAAVRKLLAGEACGE